MSRLYSGTGAVALAGFFAFAIIATDALVSRAMAADELAQAGAEQSIERQMDEMERINSAISSLGGIGALKREVTYAEVLKDPDNIELNILYARTQIFKGRLDRAQAALERILLQQPNLQNVRMLYAVVLYRLGNFVEAEGVFRAISETAGPDEGRETAKRYLASIEEKKRKTSFTLSAALGAHYDSNKNSAPLSGDMLLLGTTIRNAADRKDDFGTVVSLSLEARHDPGLQRAHEIYAKTSLMTDQQAAHDNLDTVFGRIEAGGVMVSDMGNLDLSVNHGRVNLGRSYYLMENGFKARWDAPGGKDYRPYLQQKLTSQIYRTEHTASAYEKNGIDAETRIGTRIRLSAVSLFDIYAMAGRKNAVKAYNAYNKSGAGVSHTMLFDDGLFAIWRASWNLNRYATNDAFVSGQTRRDTKLDAGITLGAPLGYFSTDPELREKLSGIQLTGSIDASRTFSNIINHEMANIGARVMLSRTFRF